MPERRFEETAILLHPTDNVAVLKKSLAPGDEVIFNSARLPVTERIGPGHKLALAPIPAEAPVRKYGQIIGFALESIRPGAHVHTHNIGVRDFGRDYQFCAEAKPVAIYPSEMVPSFQGYARPGGRAGTRNYVAVISSVNCSASVSHYVRDRFRNDEFRRRFPNVDGVI
ncbi:MAG: UxaA family hydrolase, partial [Limisphaerales bacterium]